MRDGQNSIPGYSHSLKNCFEWRSRRRGNRAAISLIGLLLAGCVVNASGPRFSERSQPLPVPGEIQVYVFRDKVLYLAQAAYISRPTVEIDGQFVGTLPNGGYLTANVTPGRHYVAVGAGGYETVRYFDAYVNGEGFIEISDKSRMEGARILGEVAEGAIGSASDSAQNGDGIQSVRNYALTGAITNALQDELFSGNIERIWAVTFPSPGDAINRLQQLSAAS